MLGEEAIVHVGRCYVFAADSLRLISRNLLFCRFIDMLTQLFNLVPGMYQYHTL